MPTLLRRTLVHRAALVNVGSLPQLAAPAYQTGTETRGQGRLSGTKRHFAAVVRMTAFVAQYGPLGSGSIKTHRV